MPTAQSRASSASAQFELIETVVQLRLGDHDRRGEPDGRAVGVLGQHAAPRPAPRTPRGRCRAPDRCPRPAHSPRRRHPTTPLPDHAVAAGRASAARGRAARCWYSPVCSSSTTARPTAQASGLPPNVLPCWPGSQHAEHVPVGHARPTPARCRRRAPCRAGRRRRSTPSCSQASVRAGPPEPGLDLVGDEQHLVARASARRTPGQVAGRRDQHAGLTLDRLQQHRDDVVVDRVCAAPRDRRRARVTKPGVYGP